MKVTVLGSGVPSAQRCSGLGHGVWSTEAPHALALCRTMHRHGHAGRPMASAHGVATRAETIWTAHGLAAGDRRDACAAYNNFFQPTPATNNNNEQTFGEIRARLGLSATTK